MHWRFQTETSYKPFNAASRNPEWLFFYGLPQIKQYIAKHLGLDMIICAVYQIKLNEK